MVFNCLLFCYTLTFGILYNKVFNFKYTNKVFEFQFSSVIKRFYQRRTMPVCWHMFHQFIMVLERGFQFSILVTVQVILEQGSQFKAI